MEMTGKCGFLGSKEAITSLRSSGYKDTSMAMGELIDNSIQADSNTVWIVLCTDYNIGKRNTRRVVTAAVVDNGSGMDAYMLQKSLVLGEGNNRYQSKGMGKFGVGLPQSSISQCKRTDVWSWTDGYSSSKHVYIDLNNEQWLNDAEIKEPDDESIPSIYRQFVKESKSGTIVQWSDLDHFSWKKPSTVYDKCETLIGRMYRYWLNSGKVVIKLVILDKNGNNEGEHEFRAVDPLFLMENAKCGNPPETPMFKIYKKMSLDYIIPVDGETKNVSVDLTFSIAKDNVRILDDGVAGFKDYGQIARSCIGVSIVREDRELELNAQWTSKDPRNRWWGAEIKFNRDLDEAFGVTNNKQAANRIDELASKSYDEIIELMDVESTGDEDRDLKALKEENPEQYVLIDVVLTVKKYIREMYSYIEKNTNKSKSSKASRHGGDSTALEKFDKMVDDRSKVVSTISESDDIAIERGDNREDAVRDALVDYDEADKEAVLRDVRDGHRGSLIVSEQDSSSFFNVDRKDTQMVVKLNSNHPMYENLFGIFDDIILEDSDDTEAIKIKAIDAFNTLKLVLLAWARMEDEERDPKRKTMYRKIREKWGEILEGSYSYDD